VSEQAQLVLWPGAKGGAVLGLEGTLFGFEGALRGLKGTARGLEMGGADGVRRCVLRR
jgi:hypothetical protein